MALTRISIADVPIDEINWQWPIYRGVYAREVALRLSLGQYVALRQAIKARNGVVSIEVTCSGQSGSGAPAMTRTIQGVRVLELTKNNDLSCTLRMADARAELAQYIAVANIQVRWRDGVLPGTDASDMDAALRKLLSRALHLFAPDGFKAARGVKVPESVMAAGSAKPRGLEYLLQSAGLDLTCDWRTGLLSFATREDIGAKPTRKPHAWVAGRRPGWETEQRELFRLPRKLRYYYKRRHMRIVPIVHDRSTVAAEVLTPLASQVFFDDGFSGTVKTSYLTGQKLFDKYAPGNTYSDAFIAKHIMSASFDGTPIARDGSRDLDSLHRILKRDWGRLYRLTLDHADSGWGALTDMAIGVFANDGSKVTQDIIAAGVRGDWVEFLNVVNGAGPNTILDQKIFTNHDDPPALPATTLLPTMPFSGTWESVEDGVLRLNQQQLPDSNFAMPGLVTNPAALTISASHQPVALPSGGVTSRWQFDLPTPDLAQLRVADRYLIIVGTQRLPNDASMFKMHELDGWPDGGLPFQEFEIPELPALYDFVDAAAPGRFDLQLHPPAGDGLGRQLNEVETLADAEARAEAFKAERGRKNSGEGVAAGLSGLDESIDGAIDEIILDMQGIVVTTAIRCDNLATEEARMVQARNRAESRRAKLGSMEKQAV